MTFVLLRRKNESPFGPPPLLDPEAGHDRVDSDPVGTFSPGNEDEGGGRHMERLDRSRDTFCSRGNRCGRSRRFDEYRFLLWHWGRNQN
jgi:hypothetical protein